MRETEANAGLGQLLKEYLNREAKNAEKANTDLAISSTRLRHQIDLWFAQGWLYDKPGSKAVKELMFDLGMRLQKGVWKRG